MNSNHKDLGSNEPPVITETFDTEIVAVRSREIPYMYSIHLPFKLMNRNFKLYFAVYPNIHGTIDFRTIFN